MNTKKFYCSILLLFILLCAMACRGKQSESVYNIRPTAGTAYPHSIPVTAPNTDLLDTAATVKGYQTQKYTLPVHRDGRYTFIVTSENPGIIFSLQDADGKDVINETSPTWTGELKRGDYTLNVGLTRNAAREDAEKEVKFSFKVERNDTITHSTQHVD